MISGTDCTVRRGSEMHARITRLAVAVGLPPTPGPGARRRFRSQLWTGANLNMARPRGDLLGAPGRQNVPPECLGRVCYRRSWAERGPANRLPQGARPPRPPGAPASEALLTHGVSDRLRVYAWNETGYGGTRTSRDGWANASRYATVEGALRGLELVSQN